MARTHLRQGTQIAESDLYDDTFSSGPTLETDASDLQFDLNAIRSQLRRVLGTPNWYDDASSGDLRQLLYFIDEGPVEGFTGGFKEIVGSPWPSSVTWYTDATKTMKIVEKIITRSAEQAPTSIVWRLYEVDGVTVRITSTDAIVNTGTPPVFESTRTRTIT